MSTLEDTLKRHGIIVPDDRIGLIGGYLGMLQEYNARMDLTNVPEVDWPERHIADSLKPLTLAGIHAGGNWVDVGTGAGFPGLPIAIAYPDIRMTLLDALQKRCVFLREVIRALGLSNAEVVCARVEDFGRGEGRGRYDAAVTRAVAKTNVLAEYMLPLLKMGGSALCWKGPKAGEELSAGSAAAALLGGSPWRAEEVPGFAEERWVLISRKTGETPDKYPRRAGLPAKRPLE